MAVSVLKNIVLLSSLLVVGFFVFVLLVPLSDAKHPPATYCTTSRLLEKFQKEASNAAEVCSGESNDLPDRLAATTGEYSVGLFQINLCGTGRCKNEKTLFIDTTLDDGDPRNCRVIVGQQPAVDACAKLWGWVDSSEMSNLSLVNLRVNRHIRKALGIFDAQPDSSITEGCDDEDWGWCPWSVSAWCSPWLNFCPKTSGQPHTGTCGGPPPPSVNPGAGRNIYTAGCGGALPPPPPPGDTPPPGPKPPPGDIPLPDPPPDDPPIDIPEGSIPKIGGLRLEVDWPAIPIPGGSITLNDIAQEEKICLSTILVFTYAISLWIAALLAAIGVVYVGIAYIFAGNRPGLQAQASRHVRKIFIGFIILFLAVVILNAIDPGLATFRTCGPGSEIEDVPLEMIEI